MPSNIRVAILGGGVAGASLIHALLQHQHIDAHIFESAAKFKEAGLAFGFTRNATAALDLIGSSATRCLERAGGVQMKGFRVSVGQGEGAGESVYDADNNGQAKAITTIVQRANFLHELLGVVPEERMHVSKKLERIDRQGDGSVLLHFADGTRHECDILLGADGIHSIVRKIILGEHDLAASPKNTGWWAIMTLQPYEKARTSIGAVSVDKEDAREFGWVGDGTFLMHNILSHGQTVQFIASSRDEDAIGTDRWHKIVSAEEVKDIFVHKDQVPHLNKAVLELLCDQPEQPVIYLWEHPPARTYFEGPIAVVGDAAHATTPWQGSGGGMCIEDTLILSTLLGRSSSPTEAQAALKVYDHVRRPRTQRVVESSHRTGEILSGESQDGGLDAEKVKLLLAPRWDFILDFDISKHRDEAVELFEVELKQTQT